MNEPVLFAHRSRESSKGAGATQAIEIAEELQALSSKGVGELRQGEGPSEELRQRPHGQEEVRPAASNARRRMRCHRPARSCGRADEVIVSPRMKHGGDADAGAEVAWDRVRS